MKYHEQKTVEASFRMKIFSSFSPFPLELWEIAITKKKFPTRHYDASKENKAEDRKQKDVENGNQIEKTDEEMNHWVLLNVFELFCSLQFILICCDCFLQNPPLIQTLKL